MLALYLLTSPHSTLAGIFRLPDGYACEDLGWDVERVAKGFVELSRNGFCKRCETTKWVWIVKHLIWNPPENPNQRKAAAKLATTIPDECCWKQAFINGCGPQIGLVEDKTCETVPEPLLNQKQEQEQKKSKAQSRPSLNGSALKQLTELGVEEQVALDWLAVRHAQHAPLTATAIASLKREAEKAGISVGQAVLICAQKSWRGFNHNWNWRDAGVAEGVKVDC